MKKKNVRNCSQAAKRVRAEESLPPLRNDQPPQTFKAMWSGYDPRKDPLETEILHEWEDNGVTLRVVRFRIGIFKGQKAMMAAVYGFPKGGKNLPGLVQIHGGGQFANYNTCLTNAARGYATVSIAWAGRITAQGYTVDHSTVPLFWAGKTRDPGYRVTTDWGALDAYHNPCRHAKTDFGAVAPHAWTLDAVDSPRNNPWFLCALGGRRALTFLERQPEVNPRKLGVYGHSMGGKITVLVAAADSRVKAAAPSCGGISDRHSDNPLYAATLHDGVNLRHIACPIIFLSPANDFHGRINDLQKAVEEIPARHWRVACSAHFNHQDGPDFQVAGPLWFDEHLKGTFRFPRTPDASLNLKTRNGVPSFTVVSHAAVPPLSVDIYYTRQGQPEGEKDDMANTSARFWRHAKARQDGKVWTAELPLLGTDKPLWAYANVLYPLEAPVTGAGYYYVTYTATRFSLSSRMMMTSPAQLRAAGVKATDQPSRLIESFGKGWEKEWFTYDVSGHWPRRTNKPHDPKWQAPPSAKLALDVRVAQPNRLVIGVDACAAEVPLKCGSIWQSVVLAPSDFHDAAGAALPSWKGIRELRLGDSETLFLHKDGKGHRLRLGAAWKGPAPAFRNLRWA